MRAFMAAAALLVLSAGAPQAGTPYVTQLTCPVGGERFEHVATASYSTWGSRPDGKPYGSWTFPGPLPQCPKNKLVVYKEFSPAEVARLKSLVASPEYRAMAARDTPYYRAAWLDRALDPKSDEAAWLLLQASWEADENPSLRARYQREFMEAAKSAPAADEMERLTLQLRAINARRELGEFDQALAELRALPIAALDVKVPAETDANYDAVEAAQNRRGMLDFIRALEKVVLRRDASPEPLDLIPARIAADICLERAAADPLCKSEPIAEAITRQRALKAELARDAAN